MIPRSVRAPLCLALILAAGPVLAQPKADPDWPCPQRKVTTLGYGSFWTGPDLAEAGEWGSDREADKVTKELQAFGQQIHRTLEPRVEGDVQVAYGRPFNGATGIAKSYREARTAEGLSRLGATG